MSLILRNLVERDRADWDVLWDGYLKFYQEELSAEQTELTWNRLLDDSYEMYALVAELEGKLVGLAHYSFTHSSWSVGKYLYLEDLFVAPKARGLGVGRSLILGLDPIAKAASSTKVWWETQSNNATARKLYDSLAELSEFVKYSRSLE